MSYGIEAAILTVLIVPLLMMLARRFGLVDRPGGRKLHSGEIPLVGGLAIYAALATVAAIHWSSLDGEALRFTLLAGTAVSAGLIDDWRGLRPLTKLALQFVIATLAVSAPAVRHFCASFISVGCVALAPGTSMRVRVPLPSGNP